MKFRQVMFGVAALLGAASAQAVVDPNTHYDNAYQFSIDPNSNGVWSYGYAGSPGGTFNAFTVSGTMNGLEAWFTPDIQSFGAPAVYHNTATTKFEYDTVTVAGSSAGFHPGPTSLAVYRFTAPAAGSYFVEASFFTQDKFPTRVDVYVFKNTSTELFSAPIGRPGDDIFDAFWSDTVTLAAGGTLDFAVGNGGSFDFLHDATGLGVQITAVPEPHTYALLGIGLGLVGAAVRRRAKVHS